MYDYESDLTETTVGELREGDQILLCPAWTWGEPPESVVLWTMHEAEIWGDEAVTDYVSEIEDAGHGLATVETADGLMFTWNRGLEIVARRAIREPAS